MTRKRYFNNEIFSAKVCSFRVSHLSLSLFFPHIPLYHCGIFTTITYSIIRHYFCDYWLIAFLITSHTFSLLCYYQVPVDDFHYLTRIHYLSGNVPDDGKWGEHEIDYILFTQKDVDVDANVNEVKTYRYVNQAQLKALVGMYRLCCIHVLVKSEHGLCCNRLDIRVNCVIISREAEILEREVKAYYYKSFTHYKFSLRGRRGFVCI